jgi:fatty acid amide hydrolase 2
VTSDLLELSVGELARMIRARELSPVELVGAHIDRIERVNPAINALVVDRFERALDEARAAERATGGLPPLHGIPCTIKDFFEVEGLPHTGGLVARRGLTGRNDAVVVDRLRRAGAIVLGKTNVPEGGMWMETHNKVYGRTRNPWRLSRTPGGSSGGEGALIGAGASPFGIGSDIAGSIRIPAAFCGIVGHKPTGRMVPNTGHWGPEGGDTGPFLTGGPMGRSVADVAMILDLIAGPDGVDPHTVDWVPPPWDRRDLSKVTVYPVEAVGHLPVSRSMRQAVRDAAQLLVAQGAKLGELRAPLLDRAFRIWAVAMTEANQNAPSFAHLLGDGEPISLRGELVRTLLGRSRVTFPALALALLERAAELVPASLASTAPKPAALQAELEEAIGPGGVMLVAPYTRPAPLHRAALLTPFHFLGTGIFNLTEFPVTQVPTGFSRRGLPIGVQVAARRGNDRLSLMVAGVLEEAFGGYRPAEPPAR